MQIQKNRTDVFPVIIDCVNSDLSYKNYSNYYLNMPITAFQDKFHAYILRVWYK